MSGGDVETARDHVEALRSRAAEVEAEREEKAERLEVARAALAAAAVEGKDRTALKREVRELAEEVEALTDAGPELAERLYLAEGALRVAERARAREVALEEIAASVEAAGALLDKIRETTLPLLAEIGATEAALQDAAEACKAARRLSVELGREPERIGAAWKPLAQITAALRAFHALAEAPAEGAGAGDGDSTAKAVPEAIEA